MVVDDAGVVRTQTEEDVQWVVRGSMRLTTRLGPVTLKVQRGGLVIHPVTDWADVFCCTCNTLQASYHLKEGLNLI